MNRQEALGNLHAICLRAGADYERLGVEAELDALKLALHLRSAQCLRTAAGLRPFLQPAVWTAAAPADEPAAPPAADDLERFRRYEVREGQVLAAYRDALDMPLDDAVVTALVAAFERALDQYVRMVEVRRALLPARAPRHDTGVPPEVAAALP